MEWHSGGCQPWAQAMMGMLSAETLKHENKGQNLASVIYYHHVLALLNNVSDKICLPEKDLLSV